MTKMWEHALNTYSYPVTLSDYINARSYPGYFRFTPIDNQANTILFENHFRSGAGTNIEFWLEVIYWKMYSQGGRRENKTNDIANHFSSAGITPDALMNACNDYIANDSRQNLQNIIGLLGFTSSAIAIAATFPTFVRPDLFPMVDTRIAKWVGESMLLHNNANAGSPQLIRPRYLDNQSTVLTLTDIDFVNSWTQWCRHKANQLSVLTKREWRPRDVEMAVFNAWGDRNMPHPNINLEILPQLNHG